MWPFMWNKLKIQFLHFLVHWYLYRNVWVDCFLCGWINFESSPSCRLGVGWGLPGNYCKPLILPLRISLSILGLTHKTLRHWYTNHYRLILNTLIMNWILICWKGQNCLKFKGCTYKYSVRFPSWIVLFWCLTSLPQLIIAWNQDSH